MLQLDIVLLLQGDAARWWSASQVAEELRVGQAVARQALEELGTTNLLDMRIGIDLTYRFAPWQPEAAGYVEEIADARYDAREIVAQRGGTTAAKRFADAFRLRTDKNNG
jgi:hypothetical protein